MPDVELLAIAADRNQPAVARNPPKRFRGNAGAVVQGSRQHAIRRHGILVDVNHDRKTLAAVAAAHVARQIAFRQRDHRVRARGPLRAVRTAAEIADGPLFLAPLRFPQPAMVAAVNAD